MDVDEMWVTRVRMLVLYYVMYLYVTFAQCRPVRPGRDRDDRISDCLWRGRV